MCHDVMISRPARSCPLITALANSIGTPASVSTRPTSGASRRSTSSPTLCSIAATSSSSGVPMPTRAEISRAIRAVTTTLRHIAPRTSRSGPAGTSKAVLTSTSRARIRTRLLPSRVHAVLRSEISLPPRYNVRPLRGGGRDGGPRRGHIEPFGGVQRSSALPPREDLGGRGRGARPVRGRACRGRACRSRARGGRGLGGRTRASRGLGGQEGDRLVSALLDGGFALFADPGEWPRRGPRVAGEDARRGANDR